MSDYEVIRPRRETWLRKALRSITLGPFNPRDREIARLFGGHSSSTGVRVDEESSLGYSAVWNAVSLISGDIAKVPLMLYRNLGSGDKEPFRDHPLYELVHDRPNPEMSSFQFRRAMQAHVLVWGNAYAEIERDQANRPIALWPIAPWSVNPYREGGMLRYRVIQQGGHTIEFAAADIVHLSGLGPDGICGYPPIRKAVESIGLGIAAEKFGAAFYGNGSTFGGIISYPPGVGGNPQTRKENREAIEARHQGVDRSHRLLTLYEGADFKQIGVPPNAAQFLETRKFQIDEVARWFNLPPHKLKEMEGGASYASIEHMAIEYATDTLQPWFRMWEGELNIKLVTRLERNIQFFEHVTEALTRGDSAAQGELMSKQFSVGAITPNEIRGKFNMNKVEGGDEVWVPVQLMPIKTAYEYWAAQIDETAAKAEAARRPPPAPVVHQAGATPAEQKAFDDALTEARKATQLAEDLRDVALAELSKAEAARDARSVDVAARDAEIVALRGILSDANTALTSANARVMELTAEIRELSDTAETAARAAAAIGVERDDARRLESDAWKAAALLSQECDVLAGRAIVAEDGERIAKGKVKDSYELVEAAEVRAQHAHVAVDAATAKAEATIAEAAASIAAAVSESDTLRTELAQARVEIAAELERARSQKATLLAAMRSLFVDASERLLQKESDRARKQQATPAKLRAWIESFYPMHQETCRAAFQPLVGPWTAMTGGAPGLLLDRLVAEHIDASRSALERAADVDEADDLAANLERTLHRWESERADAMADALVREGMGNHG